MQHKSNMHTITAMELGIRVDRWFQRHFPGITHGRLQKLLRTGQVRIDGKRARASDRLMTGQVVRVPPHHVLEAMQDPADKMVDFIPNAKDEAFIKSLIIYQDDDIIALNKPAGLAVQGGTNVKRHVDSLLPYLTSQDGQVPLLVHRLDKDTSGVLLLARHPYAASWLASAFYHQSTRKTYWAIVVGVPKSFQGTINLPLKKTRFGTIEKITEDHDHGLEAITDYKVIDKCGNKLTWLELCPHTGRTHQLRVHCLSLGTPILGDGKYGGEAAFPFGRVSHNERVTMHLHAHEIIVPKPVGGTVKITAPLPAHMMETWENFGFFKQTA